MSSVYKNILGGLLRRTGKTDNDRRGGAAARNAANKATRAAFLADPHSNPAHFPVSTCNGRRNRNPNR